MIMSLLSMKTINKYMLSLIVELFLLLFYIFFPKTSLIFVGVRGNQINILGLLLFFSLHYKLGYYRDEQIKNDLKQFQRFNIIVDILRIALVIISVYRLQLTLDGVV